MNTDKDWVTISLLMLVGVSGYLWLLLGILDAPPSVSETGKKFVVAIALIIPALATWLSYKVWKWS